MQWGIGGTGHRDWYLISGRVPHSLRALHILTDVSFIALDGSCYFLCICISKVYFWHFDTLEFILCVFFLFCKEMYKAFFVFFLHQNLCVLVLIFLYLPQLRLPNTSYAPLTAIRLSRNIFWCLPLLKLLFFIPDLLTFWSHLFRRGYRELGIVWWECGQSGFSNPSIWCLLLFGPKQGWPAVQANFNIDCKR